MLQKADAGRSEVGQKLSSHQLEDSRVSYKANNNTDACYAAGTITHAFI